MKFLQKLMMFMNRLNQQSRNHQTYKCPSRFLYFYPEMKDKHHHCEFNDLVKTYNHSNLDFVDNY